MTLTEFMDERYKNREDKDNIYGVGVSDAEFRKFIIDYLLGEEWYIADPLGQIQINEIALYQILKKYSKRYRKEIKDRKRGRSMDTTNNEVFENGYASGKTDGFDEAWKLARRILYDYSNVELRDMFGISDHYDIFCFPVEDIRQCFKEYKEKIKVGDVVKYGRHVGVVLQIEDNNIARVLTKSSKGNGHFMVATFPVSTLIKLAEGVESFSDILENIKYVNE